MNNTKKAVALLDADDSTGDSGAGSSCLLALFRACLSHVISSVVYYESSPDDVVGAMKRNDVVRDVDSGDTITTGVDVT
jgi:hypothetical protein